MNNLAGLQTPHGCAGKKSLSLMLQEHVALLRHSEEELSEAQREAARRSGEVLAERGEVQRLRVEMQKQEEEVKWATGQRQNLSCHIRRLSQELKELQSKHQVAGSGQSHPSTVTLRSSRSIPSRPGCSLIEVLC